VDLRFQLQLKIKIIILFITFEKAKINFAQNSPGSRFAPGVPSANATRETLWGIIFLQRLHKSSTESGSSFKPELLFNGSSLAKFSS